MNQPLQWALPKPGWGPRLLRQELHSPEVLLGQSETWTGARSKFAKPPIFSVGRNMGYGWSIPYAPCMVYLSTKLGDFGQGQMLVNIPYMFFFGDDIENAGIMDCTGTWWDPHSQNLPMPMRNERGFLWEWGSHQPPGAQCSSVKRFGLRENLQENPLFHGKTYGFL